jgi:hypothetical protein
MENNDHDLDLQPIKSEIYQLRSEIYKMSLNIENILILMNNQQNNINTIKI